HEFARSGKAGWDPGEILVISRSHNSGPITTGAALGCPLPRSIPSRFGATMRPRCRMWSEHFATIPIPIRGLEHAAGDSDQDPRDDGGRDDGVARVVRRAGGAFGAGCRSGRPEGPGGARGRPGPRALRP